MDLKECGDNIMKLEISGLPTGTSQVALDFSAEKLMEIFATFGEVSEALVMRRRGSGVLTGTGYVTMSDEDAERAIAVLEGSPGYGDQKIKIKKQSNLRQLLG